MGRIKKEAHKMNEKQKRHYKCGMATVREREKRKKKRKSRHPRRKANDVRTDTEWHLCKYVPVISTYATLPPAPLPPPIAPVDPPSRALANAISLESGANPSLGAGDLSAPFAGTALVWYELRSGLASNIPI